jgi:nucleotide-binding universal stress UspA family protein
MYNNILVPLDGSDLAECVLPHAEAIALGCSAGEIRLVRVIESVALPAPESPMDEQERQRIESSNIAYAEEYLSKVVNRLGQKGITSKSEVLFGKVAETLADYAEANKIALIIISTHGRSGLSRWVWGSVTDRLLRSTSVPIMVVRPPGCAPGI